MKYILPIVSIVVTFWLINQSLYYRILTIKLVNQEKELQWKLYYTITWTLWVCNSFLRPARPERSGAHVHRPQGHVGDLIIRTGLPLKGSFKGVYKGYYKGSIRVL